MCNPRYNLTNERCIANYSIRAIYESTADNDKIKVIHNSYKDNIINMEIDEENIIPCTEYTFKKPGFHTIYYLINTTNLT